METERNCIWYCSIWGDGNELYSYYTGPMTKTEAKKLEEKEEQKWKRTYGDLYDKYEAYASFWEYADQPEETGK